MIERPVASMMVVRVETDWYAHDTEFRYVLQAGEGITVEHSIPIGQVFFVPREEITMRACTADELKKFEESRAEFNRHKAATVQTTSYGLAYSPQYLRQSRVKKSDADSRAITEKRRYDGVRARAAERRHGVSREGGRIAAGPEDCPYCAAG
jgi:hypothetical protein